MRLRILGAPLFVDFEAGVSAAQRAELRRAWSRCLEDGEDPALGDTALGDTAQPSATPYRARILAGYYAVPVSGGTFPRFAAELTSALTFTAIERRSGELLMLHASGLADPSTGRIAALVGPSGVGKTTATRALARGLGYVSDETVGVEPSGAVVPYAKPLSVIIDGSPAPKRQLGPDELGLRESPTRGKLGAIVLLERVSARGPRPVEVRPLGHADAIVGLAPHTSSLGKLRDPLQWICRVLDACGGAVRVVYAEADHLTAIMPGLLARPPVAGGWAPAVVPSTRADDDADDGVDDGASDGVDDGDLPPQLLSPDHAPSLHLPSLHLPSLHLQRADVVDAVEISIPGGGETELLVMVGHQVLRLGGIAPAVWRALRSPARFEDLAERIAPEVGLPPGYEEALSHAVGVLSDCGVLTRS